MQCEEKRKLPKTKLLLTFKIAEWCLNSVVKAGQVCHVPSLQPFVIPNYDLCSHKSILETQKAQMSNQKQLIICKLDILLKRFPRWRIICT